MNFKKTLSDKALLQEVQNILKSNLTDSRMLGKVQFSLVDVAMATLAMFRLKFPSLLQFKLKYQTEIIKKNLFSLYNIFSTPSDTQMREILDQANPVDFRGVFTGLFKLLQRAKILTQFRFHNKKLLLALDGTGYFSSSKIHCSNCCEKHHQNGTVTYYHQVLTGVFIHPDKKIVIPITPEPIIIQDGVLKNDCERNAAERLLEWLAKEHPNLKIIITEDGLGSNGPHIKTIFRLGFSFILGAKPGDHQKLYEILMNFEEQGLLQMLSVQQINGDIYTYRWLNNLPLNASHPDVIVNWLELTITNQNGACTVFSWVTDLHLGRTTVAKIARGGRARWKIENETFNTLKNQGYNLEHNYGHGYNNLSVILMTIMFIAFLIDQIIELTCEYFSAAFIKSSKNKKHLWSIMRDFFTYFIFEDWKQFYNAIIIGIKAMPPPLNI